MIHVERNLGSHETWIIDQYPRHWKDWLSKIRYSDGRSNGHLCPSHCKSARRQSGGSSNVGNHVDGSPIEVFTGCGHAVGGADLSAAVDGEPVCPWKSFRVYTGQILSFGKPVHGTYAYLAVSGGFYAETVMGSKSTYAQANLGGIEGRILQKGDRLSAEDKNLKSIRTGRYLKKTDIPNYEQHRPIRVITGPDISAFSDTIYQQFLQESYRITEQSNRMGYRLEGKALSHVDKADIISDAVLPGTIQVPANGQPIVLLADRQTTGGYARIATVIAADIPQLVQKKIGAEVRFLSVPLERAHADYLAQQRYFKILRTAVRSEE